MEYVFFEKKLALLSTILLEGFQKKLSRILMDEDEITNLVQSCKLLTPKFRAVL